MKIFLLTSFWVIISTATMAQDFPVAKFINMVSVGSPKSEAMLLSKKFISRGSSVSGDTTFKTFEFIAPRKKKKAIDNAGRQCVVATLNGSAAVTYQTTDHDEYLLMIDGLRKEGFHCDYDKDSTREYPGYVYQSGLYSAEASQKNLDGQTWYNICFTRKTLTPNYSLQTGEDLLEFTSHETLVHFFGEKNVKKDLYYFADNDIVNCSVLFINTSKQVIFVWKDGLNRRRIANVLIGGQQNLKSQQSNEKVIAENSWKLKSGVRVGMTLLELRNLNDHNFAFCGGKAPNPGLVLPSSGKLDFSNADIVLGCVNCTDDKFLASAQLSSDRAMEDGRILFVLSIVLYPTAKPVFE